MRVGMVSSFPPPPTGVATYTRDLVAALERRGISVTILASVSQREASESGISWVWNEGSLFYPLQIIRGIIAEGCDLVHIQHEYWLYGRGYRSISFPLLCFLVRLLGIPLVVTLHGIIDPLALTRDFFERHWISPRFVSTKRSYVVLYTKVLALFASKLVVHSQTSRAILFRKYGIPRDRVTVIPHGVEIEENNTKSPPITGGRRKVRRIQILVFGQIRRGKGLEDAVDSMLYILSEVPACILLIAGMYNEDISPESAGYLEELKEKVENLRLTDNIIFRTPVKESEVAALFAGADLVLLPYRESEIVAASGPALLALAYGKPIVATDLPRFEEYLSSQNNAILVPPRDIVSIANGVIKLLGDDSLRASISDAAKESAKRYSWSKVAARTIALYTQFTVA